MFFANEITATDKFEFIRLKYVGLRDNLKQVLDYLRQDQSSPEAQIHYYQIMLLKTNFFIDEIDFHLRGIVTTQLFSETVGIYSKFYQRSRSELSNTLDGVCPNRHFIW